MTLSSLCSASTRYEFRVLPDFQAAGNCTQLQRFVTSFLQLFENNLNPDRRKSPQTRLNVGDVPAAHITVKHWRKNLFRDGHSPDELGR